MNGYGYSGSPVFFNAIKKYGWDGFDHIIIESDLSEKIANRLEIEYIRRYNTMDRNYGYNMTSGGNGASGRIHTEESKLKMSISKSGTNHPNFGKHLRDETKNKISKRLTGNSNPSGCIRSKEVRLKISESKYKPVSAYIDDMLVNTYSSAKSAEDDLGVNRKNISLCCYGKRKHAGGYAWKFA